MDIEKLIEAVRLCGSTPKVDQCKQCAYWAGGDMSKCIPQMTAEAATALSTLQAENEKLRDEIKNKVELVFQQAKELDRRNLFLQEQEAELDDFRKQWDMYGGDVGITAVYKELEQVKRERRIIPKGYALVKLKLLEELDNFRALGSIDRLRELKQADDEGRCVVFQPGYAVVSIYNPADEDGLYTMKVAGVITKEEYEAALRREQDG